MNNYNISPILKNIGKNNGIRDKKNGVYCSVYINLYISNVYLYKLKYRKSLRKYRHISMINSTVLLSSLDTLKTNRIKTLYLKNYCQQVIFILLLIKTIKYTYNNLQCNTNI